MITKEEFDKLVETYETEDFIKDDPIQFPHRFKAEKDVEIAGFVASCFAYGNRKVFIKKLNELFEIMNNEPYEFVMNFDSKPLKDFNYRFSKGKDTTELLQKISHLYQKGSSLRDLFLKNFDNEMIPMLQCVCDYFYADCDLTQGYCHFVPNPKKGGAMKRLNMFLRWMVRKSPVDLGVWDFIKPSQLYIPLDTHVARISRELNLLTRNANDMKSVIELTEALKSFDAKDPIKYDFALFGYGVNHPIK